MKEARRKKNLGGYPAIGVTFSIALALFVMGIFGLLIIYSQKLEKEVRENLKLHVYLKSNLTETQRLQIENKLLSDKYVNKEAGKGVSFFSKEEAEEKFIKETGEDFRKLLGENPLHDAYLVSIDKNYQTKKEMDKIKVDLQKMNGVFQVFYVEDLFESVNKNVTNIGLMLIALIAVLLVTVIFLINNTLRLAVFSQRFLIRSMQLVGAKTWFIQRPFLIRAAGYGIIAAGLASGLLWSISNYAQSKIQDLTLLHNPDQFLILVCGLFVIGITIAIMGTYVAIQKYLRMSLDELY